MKKPLSLLALALALVSVVTLPAQATTVNSAFDVSVSLVAICTANNSGSTTLDFGSYTAFGAQKTGSVDLTFTCTRGLTAPTFTFDTTNGSADGYGVLAGLNYSLTATNAANVTTGTAATATSGGLGTADVRKVTVNGTMAAGQAGTCASTASGCTSAASHTRTLTVTY